MYHGFKQKSQLKQRISALILSFVCLFGVGMGDLSYTKLLESGLGGGYNQTQERSFVSGVFSFLCGVDPTDLPGVLGKGLPFSVTEGKAAAASAEVSVKQPVESPLHLEKPSLEEELASKPVTAALYHTHNAETYIPLDNKSKVEGKNAGITLVGEEIVKTLSEHGIHTVHDLTIHDYPDFPTSYIKSKSTANRLLQEHSELKVLIDIHRDAGISKKQTVMVDGQEAAKILFMIGNGQRISNPHWRENYAFARQVANRLQEKYPGIVKAVRLTDGGYNQNLSPRAILVEIGSDKNTLDEALLSGRCLGVVLAELLQEDES